MAVIPRQQFYPSLQKLKVIKLCVNMRSVSIRSLSETRSTLAWFRRTLHILAGILLLLSPLSVFAQAQDNPNTQIQTQDLLKKDVPLPSKSVKAKSAEEKEWDREFGRIFELEHPKPWTITPYSSTLTFWTSNARLDSQAEKEDWVLLQREGVNLNYHLDENWKLGAGYAFEIIRYDRNADLDTNAHIPEFYINRRLPWNWNVTIGDRGTWLDSPRSNTEVYRENRPYLLATQSHPYLNNHLYWFYGFQYDHRFTNPVSFDRDEYTLFTGVSHDWTPKLVSQFMIRQNWQIYDFQNPNTNPSTSREEWISSGILQTIWQPLPWLQITGFAMAIYDNSINSARDFKTGNVGAEVRLFWKF